MARGQHLVPWGILALSWLDLGCGHSSAMTASGAIAGTDDRRPQATQTASAEFVPAEIDLGSHPWFTRVPFQVLLVNAGSEPVSIATITPSCGCTVIDNSLYHGVSLDPGDVLEVEGVLTTAGEPGRFSKKIDVLLGSGALRTAYLNYETYTTYDFAPMRLDFGTVRLYDTDTDLVANVAFTSRTASIVEPPRGETPWLHAALVPREEGANIAVHVDRALLPYGRNHGRVRVTTDDATRSVFWVDVVAEGRAALRAVPDHVFLRRGESRTVRFLRDNGESIRHRSINCDSSDISVRPADDASVWVTPAERAESGPPSMLSVS